MDKPTLRFDARYFGFNSTGVTEIDEILARIAEAGYVFHHTRSWSEPAAYDGGPSYADLIQKAAKQAADTIERQAKELAHKKSAYDYAYEKWADTAKERDAALAEVERLKGALLEARRDCISLGG